MKRQVCLVLKRISTQEKKITIVDNILALECVSVCR